MIRLYHINGINWDFIKFQLIEDSYYAVPNKETTPDWVFEWLETKQARGIMNEDEVEAFLEENNNNVDVSYILPCFHVEMPDDEKERIGNGEIALEESEYFPKKDDWSKCKNPKRCWIELYPDCCLRQLVYCKTMNQSASNTIEYVPFIMGSENYVKNLFSQKFEDIDALNFFDDIEITLKSPEELDYNTGTFLQLPGCDGDWNNSFCNDDTTIVHTVSSGTDISPVYRRYFLNEYLKKSINGLKTNALGKCKTCIVSQPTVLVPEAEHYYYDRTDYWSWSHSIWDNEQNILLKAEKISCSSKWLYEDTIKWLEENRPNDNVEVKYIPNGNMIFDYPDSVEKFERTTFVYAGNNLNKVDLVAMSALAFFHPEVDILVYANSSTLDFSLPENIIIKDLVSQEELFTVLCKSHAGLLAMNNTEWVKGQLSNKIFQYFNAHIPILYSGICEQNYEEYKCAMKSLQDYNADCLLPEVSNEEYDSMLRTWDDVIRDVKDFFEL